MRTIGTMAAAALMCGVLAGAGEGKRVEVQAKEIGSKYVIMGPLGKPLGTYMTISGQRGKPMMMSGTPFQVDTIDSKKLTEAQLVGIKTDTKSLGNGKYTFRGYETGAMISTPMEPGSTGPEPQTNYHFATWFVVIATTEPSAPADSNADRP